MATVRTTIRTCDRCAFGKVLPASTHRTFAIEDRYYRIDLCDKDAAAFDRDLGAWTRLAVDIDNPYDSSSRPASATYTPERAERARVVLQQSDEIRHAEQQTIFAKKRAEQLAEEAEKHARQTIPGALNWTMTRHARERMLKRGFTAGEVYMAVTIPSHRIDQDWRNPGTVLCIRNECRVVVNAKTHIIITVIDRDAKLETAQPATTASTHREEVRQQA